MNKRNILYLYDRPMEPMYMLKGEKKVAFDVPSDFLPDNIRSMGVEMFHKDRGTAEKIPIKQIELPNIEQFRQLKREEIFSPFIPEHRKMAASLTKMLYDMDTLEDFFSASTFCRDKINPQMFMYSLSVAILHRPDTKDLPIPSMWEFLPEKCFSKATINEAMKMANSMPDGYRPPVEIPQEHTASDLDDEHRLAYWREDIGINIHHWHWHLVYPFEGDIDIVNKDRRGELFYYMHHQIQARYNCERLCNGLSRVKRFHDWREPILEGYFPKLDSAIASRAWASRPAGSVLKDVNRPEIHLSYDIQDLERWRDRIFEIIHSGFYIDSRGENVLLDEENGVGVLGNIMESSILSPNRSIYGDLHNLAHLAICYCHDPDNRYLEGIGVMGDPATAMRDPVFYTFHGFVDRLFLEYKNTLPEYSVEQLNFPNVEITEIWVQTPNQSANVLTTSWNKSTVDLSSGLDFTPRGRLLVKFTHLNHANFTYNIVVMNRSKEERRGTVRIFISPKRNERGMLYEFREQKELMIELDKFTVSLHTGRNTIQRSSTESSVTIPFEKTFRHMDEDNLTEEEFNFCGCGWPQHMLIPKGTGEGFPMELFIMISDYTNDVVQQNEGGPSNCKEAASFCGLRDRKYPDKRSMGYPFDRRPRANINTLNEFRTPNMAVTDIIIRHTNRISEREASRLLASEF